jgi:hypothetical protein
VSGSQFINEQGSGGRTGFSGLYALHNGEGAPSPTNAGLNALTSVGTADLTKPVYRKLEGAERFLYYHSIHKQVRCDRMSLTFDF